MVKHLPITKRLSKCKALLLIGLLTTTIAPNTQAAINLPELSTPSQSTLSVEQEQRLGRAFMQAVRAQTRILSDPATLAYVKQLGNQLSAHTSPQLPHPYTFFVVNDPSINAFAGPGGYIGVNTGLITTTENEAELAAVMAHEITHVSQRHIARGIDNSSQSTLPSVGAIVAALLLGGGLDPAITTGAIMTAAAGKMQHTINFTRRFEQEADRIGMRVLFDTGFNPNAMPDFFGRMQNRTLDYSDPRLKILRTHPVTEDRIADSQNRAQSYPKRPDQVNPSYPLIKARIQAMTAPTRQDILTEAKTRFEFNPDDQANQYGYAMALFRNHQPQKAQAFLQALKQAHPNNPLYHYSLAETQLETSPSQAKITLEKGYSQFPSYNPIMLSYSRYLLDHQHADVASRILSAHQKNNAEDLSFYALLAQAQGQNHQLVEAYQSRAKLFALANQPARAITQLNQAIRLAKDNPLLVHKLKRAIHSLEEDMSRDL
jgi:beta-barrel assembly-enhancing protease